MDGACVDGLSVVSRHDAYRTLVQKLPNCMASQAAVNVQLLRYDGYRDKLSVRHIIHQLSYVFLSNSTMF